MSDEEDDGCHVCLAEEVFEHVLDENGEEVALCARCVEIRNTMPGVFSWVIAVVSAWLAREAECCEGDGACGEAECDCDKESSDFDPDAEVGSSK